MNRRYAFPISLVLYSSLSNGQQASLPGRVYTAKGEEVPGAFIQLSGDEAKVTDPSGSFVFKDLKPGDYSMIASFMGFRETKENFRLDPAQILTINVTFKEHVTRLHKVTVTGTGIGYITGLVTVN